MRRKIEVYTKEEVKKYLDFSKKSMQKAQENNVELYRVLNAINSYRFYRKTGKGYSENQTKIFREIENEKYPYKDTEVAARKLDTKNPFDELNYTVEMLKSNIMQVVEYLLSQEKNEKKIEKVENEKIRKNNTLLLEENKRLHEKLEEIQNQSILGMLKNKFEGGLWIPKK